VTALFVCVLITYYSTVRPALSNGSTSRYLADSTRRHPDAAAMGILLVERQAILDSLESVTVSFDMNRLVLLSTKMILNQFPGRLVPKRASCPTVTALSLVNGLILAHCTSHRVSYIRKYGGSRGDYEAIGHEFMDLKCRK
jgi:hypothetical protein